VHSHANNRAQIRRSDVPAGVRDDTRSFEFNESGSSSSSKARSVVDDDSDTPENIAACVRHSVALSFPCLP
jgi:hypothetical protein